MTPLLAASYTLLNQPPAALFHGEAALLQLELRNTGRSPWITVGPHPLRLGYRWLDPAGAVVADGGRAELPGPVPPDMVARLELRVSSPPAPGAYTLQVELVEEGVAWLSARGVAPLSLALSYAPATAPRVAILNGNVVANDAVGGHIVSQLRALRAAGYHTMVLTEFVDERLPADVRRSIEVVRPDMLGHPAFAHAVDHLARADVVIVNYSTYYALAEQIRNVRRGVVIFDYHGVTPPELWGPEWPGYADLVRGRENLALVEHADYAVGHSQFTCDELVATGKIAPGRVSLMPYAVVEDAGYAGPPDPAVLEALGLAGRHVLLYVGRIARNKGVHVLIEAMPAILARHPEAALLIVGDDKLPAYRAYADELRELAARLGVAEAVVFAGQVDDATLESCYRACAALVTASVHEGFCMPVVEAMARGRPVIAADATATPGTLGGAGLLFAPGDAAGLAAHACALLAELPAPGDYHRDPLALHELPPATPEEIAALRGRKIAVVAPRYGPRVLGGAESGIRSWAEQLAARGHTVEALTTCTIDIADWSDHVPPGVEELNGVTVRRFSTSKVDAAAFHSLLQKANRGERLRSYEEQRFMANNLRSADLERYVAEHADEYACLIYTPYLFGTSYWPVLAAPERAAMVPCLHDEPSARFGVFRDALERAAALFFNTDPESALASDELGVRNPYRVRIGYGFPDEPAPGDPEAFRARSGVTGPYLLYSGRLEGAKNVPLLIEHFVRYKAERPGPLTLVLAGSGDVPVPERPDIVGLGMISDRQQLADIYAGALALCQLSQNESFSIVIMESWQHGRPVLVHEGCAVTRDHVEKCGGGYAVASYESFRAALDALLADPAHGDELGARGRDYVREHYVWSRLLDRIEASIARFSRPRPLYARLAQRGVARALAFTRRRFEDELLRLVELGAQATPAALASAHRAMLQQAAAISRPGYRVRSGLPVVGPAIAWLRRQLTAHLKEPYLDPMIAEQERFNKELIEALLPTLDASLREQRRLRAEIDLLRAKLESQRKPPNEQS